MINLSGLNFNFNLPKSTVPSMTEQIGYTAPAQDTYVDLFGDTTAPDIGTLGPGLNFGSNNLLGFQEFNMTPEQKIDYGIATPQEQLAIANDPWAGVAQIGKNLEEAAKTPEGAAQIQQMKDIGRSSTKQLYEAGDYDATSGEYRYLEKLKNTQYDDPVMQGYLEQQIALLQSNPDFMSRVSKDIIADAGGFDNWWKEGEGMPGRGGVGVDISDPEFLTKLTDLSNKQGVTWGVEGIQELSKAIADRSYALAKANDKQGTQLAKIAGGIMLSAVGAPALASSLGVSSTAAAGIINSGLTLAQGGDIEDAVKSGLLTYVGGELGNRVTAGAEFGLNPFGEQAGMLAEQASGLGSLSATATALGNATDSLVRTGELDPTSFISGSILQEHGASELVADAVDFTKAYAQDDYATMLGIASDYVDLPEGDGLSFDTPEFLKEFDKEVLQPAKDMLEEAGGVLYEDVIKPAGQAVADVAEPIYEDVIKPLGDTVVDVAQAIDDEVIDPFVSTVQDTIIDPLQEAGQTVYEDVIQPVGQTVADVGEAVYEAQKPVGQAIADVATGVYDALPDVTIDLPSVDLPNINLPSIDWQGLFGALLAGSQGMFSGGGGVPGTSQASQDAIQTELLDYKPITPYRSKLSPSARLFG